MRAEMKAAIDKAEKEWLYGAALSAALPPFASPAELAAAIAHAYKIAGTESGHELADRLLLHYIGDADVTETFERQERWYA